MTDRELMQQALVALEAMQSYAAAEKKGLRICDEAIEALRARLEKWTARDMAYRPGGLSQEEQELVAWSRVNMNDHKEGDLGIGTVEWDASAPLVVHPHPAFQATQPQPDLAKVGEVGVWGEQQLPLKARHAAQEALNALMRWQEICLAKNRSTKELTISTKAIHALTEILEVKGGEQ